MNAKRPLVGISMLSVLFCAAALAAAALAAPSAPAAPFQVCIAKGGQAGPEIAGSMVVWTDDRSGNFDIYGKDLGVAGSKDFAVCSNTAAQSNPAITQMAVAGGSQYLVVWVDGRNHRSSFTDIYGRNLTTKKNFLVARSQTIKWFPAIADQWVLWVESVKASRSVHRPRLRSGHTQAYTVATSNVLSPLAVARTAGQRQGRLHRRLRHRRRRHQRPRPARQALPSRSPQTSKFEWSPDISGDTRRVVGGRRPHHAQVLIGGPADVSSPTAHGRASDGETRRLGRRRARRRVRHLTTRPAPPSTCATSRQHQGGHRGAEGPHLPLPRRQRKDRGVGVRTGAARARPHPHLRRANL